MNSRSSDGTTRPDRSGPDASRTLGDDLAEEQAAAAVDEAIATDLAPAAAIALLAKTDHDQDQIPPAMLCISAGVSSPGEDGRIRIQFLFEGGSVLPIEMPREAGQALARGLLGELGSAG